MNQRMTLSARRSARRSARPDLRLPAPRILALALALVLISSGMAVAQPAAPTTADLEQLRAKIAELEAWKEAQELEQLRRSADAAVSGEGDAERLELKSFQGGARALQAINPEISVTGDMFLRAIMADGQDFEANPPTEFAFRGLGLHLQSNLDPFSFVKAAISFGPDGAEFGEAYVTWTNVLPHFNLTMGKFRQQLGVVNRWHKHALDYFDFPLMLREPFGPGGLNQIGLSLEWFMPALWADEQAVILQVTDGMNGKVFDRDGSLASIPSILLKLRSYWDLNRDTYLELGLTGMIGWNDANGPDFDPAHTEPTEITGAGGDVFHVLSEVTASGTPNDGWHKSMFGAADLTLAWEPLNRAKYAGFTWRTEFLYARKELPAGKSIDTFGGYTSLDGRVWRNWNVGVRGDLVQRFAYGADDELLWQVSPYVTWWQSPWVRLHLEYEYLDGTESGFRHEHRVVLQAVFAAGPHKHDRY